MARYHIFDGTTQTEEYEIEMTEARLAIEEYKKTAKDLVDVNTVELLTDASDLSAGKAIFATNCVVCHKADGGGGIGPNLTDEYWIHGGGPLDIHNTVVQGVTAKGMAAWGRQLGPDRVDAVVAFVLTLRNTNVPGKAPEGELYQAAPGEAAEPAIVPGEPAETEMETAEG